MSAHEQGSAPATPDAREPDDIVLDILDFLRQYRAALEDRCRVHMDEADRSDDDGSHIGFARHQRALACGLNEAILALDEMWRERSALGNQAPPAGAPTTPDTSG